MLPNFCVARKLAKQIFYFCSCSACSRMLAKTICHPFYCALERSNLEYCCLIWSPYTTKGIEKLERVERRATKFILKTEDTYACRLNKLNLLSLEKRRLLADSYFFIKLLMRLLTSMLNLMWIFIRKLIAILLDTVIS